MIVIKIPQEIKEFKEKVVLGLTVRQFVCSLLACIVSVPVYTHTKDVVGVDIAQTLVIVVGIPIILIGLKPIEKDLWLRLKFHIGYSKTRIISSKNFWEEIIEEADIENKQMKKMRKHLTGRKDID